MTASNTRGSAHQRIAIIYDNTRRPDTTGEYCRRALADLGFPVSHYLPSEAGEIPPIYSLYFRVDDDQECALPDHLHPLVYWAIDTHLGYERRLASARAADVVFCAQRDGALRLRADGVRNAHWLPLACDPAVHHRVPDIRKTYDVCFVGNTFPGDGRRTELVGKIREAFPRSFVGQAYGEEMARIYSASRLVFNCAIRNDINMRVFEATACGSLLITNDLADNGQDRLFTPGEHLITYREGDDLTPLIQQFLHDEAERERIAEAGMRHVQAHHSYRRRMTDVLEVIGRGNDLEERYPVTNDHVRTAAQSPHTPAPMVAGNEANNGKAHITAPSACAVRVSQPAHEGPVDAGARRWAGRPRVSIVIPTFNHLSLTQQCVGSIRGSSAIPYEIIIVDNGSSDGTAVWARGEGLRVIANPENLGFPRACNQGILAADGEYVLLLNNDTQVPPMWLERLVAHAEADAAVGLVGPSTNFAAGSQRIPATYSTRDEFLEFAQGIARTHAGCLQDVQWLVGLCLLIPRRVIDAIGLLDERFGLGNYEDNDYCLRARIAGYRVTWAQDVFIHHVGHQSFRDMGDAFQRLLAENEQRYKRKWDLQEYREVGAAPVEGADQAWSLLKAERYAEAYDAFEAALRGGQNGVQVWIGLGLAAEGRGVPAAAKLAYETVLALVPEQPDATRGLARLMANGHGAPIAKGIGSPSIPATEPPPGYYDHARPDVQALVPADARMVLDVGCGAGRLGAALRADGRRVIGIEVDPEQAARARTQLDDVLVGDVENMNLSFPAGTFDCIICADILEHLRDPWAFLARCRSLLTPQGTLVASIPNVQFVGVLRELANGDFTYRSAGILDRTHLRFFTRREFARGLRQAGFAARSWTPIIPPELERLAAQTSGRAASVVVGPMTVREVPPQKLEGFIAVQYVVAASPVSDTSRLAEDDASDEDASFRVAITTAEPAPEETTSTTGWDLLRAQRYADAYDAFEREVRANPSHTQALLGLGLAAEGRGVPAAAALAYRTVLSITPSDQDALRWLSRVTARETAGVGQAPDGRGRL